MFDKLDRSLGSQDRIDIDDVHYLFSYAVGPQVCSYKGISIFQPHWMKLKLLALF